MGNVGLALLPEEEPGPAAIRQTLHLWVDRAINMPADHLSVEICKRSRTGSKKFEKICSIEAKDKGSCSPSFTKDHPLDLGHMFLEDVLEFSVMEHKLMGVKCTLGSTEWRVRDLVKRPEQTMTLTCSNELLLTGEKRALSFLRVRPCLEKFPPTWEKPRERPEGSFPKHMMLITRGTRGDVQPFVALAEGLANILGWKVTICTELRYKEKIQKAAGPLKQGLTVTAPDSGCYHRVIQDFLVQGGR